MSNGCKPYFGMSSFLKIVADKMLQCNLDVIQKWEDFPTKFQDFEQNIADAQTQIDGGLNAFSCFGHASTHKKTCLKSCTSTKSLNVQVFEVTKLFVAERKSTETFFKQTSIPSAGCKHIYEDCFEQKLSNRRGCDLVRSRSIYRDLLSCFFK